MSAWRSFAIVPAAGRSVRMGQPKLLLPWGSSTVIEQVLAAWRASRVTATCIVLHPADVELATIAERCGVTRAIAATPPPDMKASLLLGRQAIDEQWQPHTDDAVLIAPADLPLLSHGTIDALLANYDPRQNESLVPLDDSGRRSHPVLIPWKWLTKLHELDDTQGLKDLLERQPMREIHVPGLTRAEDIDTPANYDRLHNRYHPH